MTSLKIIRLLQVMCYWSLKLIFMATLKIESGHPKLQYGGQAAIMKVTLLKINKLLPIIAISDIHMGFKIGISKQTRVTSRKPCRLLTDGRTDNQRQPERQSDRQIDTMNPVYPYQLCWQGHDENNCLYMYIYMFFIYISKEKILRLTCFLLSVSLISLIFL